jgi:hypothetical protein
MVERTREGSGYQLRSVVPIVTAERQSKRDVEIRRVECSHFSTVLPANALPLWLPQVLRWTGVDLGFIQLDGSMTT